MRAAYIEETGPPEVIKVGELPDPTVSPGRVLVRVQAVVVNPIDSYIRSGAYKIPLPRPFIVGRDMVGTVEEVGNGVEGFAIGDRVWCNNQGYAGRQGTFAERLSIEDALLYRLPDKIDPLDALASAHSALTSVVALQGKAQLRPGERLFINGGSGNVGTCAIQLAKSLGALVAVTAGSTEKADWCRHCGADLVIDYKRENIVTAVKEFAPAGVNVYWDLTRQPDVQTALDVVGRRARILLSSGLTHTATFKVGDFYTRNCTAFGFTITELDTVELRQYAELINNGLASGTFKSRIAKTLSLMETPLAHKLVGEDQISGKVVVRMD